VSRYVIFGAGAVGTLLGGRLAEAGLDVVLVARGEQARVMARDGLRLKRDTGETVVRLPVCEQPSEVGFIDGDVVVLTMKTHHALPALEELAALAGPDTTLLTAQNGLEGERMALRFFERVYGVYAYLFAALPEPGVTACYTSGCAGILDLGRPAGGGDEAAEAIARDFRAAGFSSTVRPDIMRWKRGKLLINSGNAITAMCSDAAGAADLFAAARAEAEACFRAEGLDFAAHEEMLAQATAVLTPCEVDGKPFPGGSTFQSLARGAGATEADYLNGEIALRGRLAGVPTPVNAGLQRMVRQMARNRAKAQSLSPQEISRQLAAG